MLRPPPAVDDEEEKGEKEDQGAQEPSAVHGQIPTSDNSAHRRSLEASLQLGRGREKRSSGEGWIKAFKSHAWPLGDVCQNSRISFSLVVKAISSSLMYLSVSFWTDSTLFLRSSSVIFFCFSRALRSRRKSPKMISR